MTFLKSQLEYFCNQAELHATLPHCDVAQFQKSWFQRFLTTSFFDTPWVVVPNGVITTALQSLEFLHNIHNHWKIGLCLTHWNFQCVRKRPKKVWKLFVFISRHYKVLAWNQLQMPANILNSHNIKGAYEILDGGFQGSGDQRWNDQHFPLRQVCLSGVFGFVLVKIREKTAGKQEKVCWQSP